MNEYYYDPEDVMAKKQPKKEPEIELQESLYGNSYPKLPPEHWMSFPGIDKPIFINEIGMFNSHYAECVESKKYYSRKELMRTNKDRFVHKSKTEGKNPKWILDGLTGYVFPAEDAVVCYYVDDEEDLMEIKVSAETAKTYTFVCDFDHKRYKKSDLRVQVTGSEKYKFICYIHCDDGVNFKKCTSCETVYEFKDLLDLGGAYYCPRCFRKARNNGVIRKHDNKEYPPKILVLNERKGHELRGGRVFATMKPEAVPEERLYGVEVETELDLAMTQAAGVDRFDIARELIGCLGRDFIICKEDGTLITNGKYSDKEHPTGPLYAGFEVVSAAAPISVHRERWKKLEEFKYLKLLRAWDDPYCRTCGFHIHLSRDAIESNLCGGRMLAFMNAEANRKFIWKVAGRSEVAFTKYMKHKISDFIHPDRVINPDEKADPRNRSRRVALNLSNDHTVEMRIFRGTVHPSHIIRNIEFYDSLFEFCMPCSRSLHDVFDYKKYVGFVDSNRKRWPQLASWFALHDIIKLKKIKRPERANFAKLTINTKEIPESELIKV